MDIKRYKLRETFDVSDIEEFESWYNGGRFITNGVTKHIGVYLCNDIYLYIGFKNYIPDFNDIDNILVYDFVRKEPYKKFYYIDDYDDEILQEVIKKYNEVMDNLWFFYEDFSKNKDLCIRFDRNFEEDF